MAPYGDVDLFCIKLGINTFSEIFTEKCRKVCRAAFKVTP
jgi:hypothetical protein